METKNEKHFRIPITFIWILLVVYYVSIILWAFNLVDMTGSLFIFGFIFGVIFLSYLLFIIDAASSDIYNKSFWIMSLIILPSLAYPFYVVQRKKLLNMQRKVNKFQVS